MTRSRGLTKFAAAARATFLLACLVLAACGARREDIAEGWSIFHGDDPSFAALELDTSAWERVDLPERLYQQPGKQVVWLRRDLSIPAGWAGEDIGVFIGKITDAEQTFLNGIQIGRTGSEEPFLPSWNQDRAYLLPPQLLAREGRNVLAIRIFTTSIPSLRSRPFIAPYREVEATAVWMRVRAQYFAFGTGLMVLCLGLVSLVLFARERSNRLALHFGGASVLWGVLSVHFCWVDYGIGYHLKERIYYSLLGVEIVWLYVVVETALGVRRRAFRWPVLLYLVACPVLCFSNDLSEVMPPFTMTALGAAGVVNQLLWGGLIAWALVKGVREARVLLVGYLAFMTTLVHDALALAEVIVPETYWIDIGYPALILSLGVVVWGRFAHMTEKLRRAHQVEQAPARLSSVLAVGRNAVAGLAMLTTTIRLTAAALNQRMEEQRRHVGETRGALQGLSQSIRSIATGAAGQEEAVKESRGRLSEYVALVEQSTRGARTAGALSQESRRHSNESRKSVEGIAEGLQRLEGVARGVADVSGVIREIAEETKILAMNASLEAVRAGEHGRGFAIVADATRKLALGTMEQAQAIQRMLREAATSLERELGSVGASARAISGIERSAADIGEAIDGLLVLSQAQENLIASIQGDMETIARGAGDITSAARSQEDEVARVEASAQELLHIVEELNATGAELSRSVQAALEHIEQLEGVVGSAGPAPIEEGSPVALSESRA